MLHLFFLIPKKLGETDIKDFRPIDLVSGVYKIIEKILANRLREVLGKVISKFQILLLKGAGFWIPYL